MGADYCAMYLPIRLDMLNNDFYNYIHLHANLIYL